MEENNLSEKKHRTILPDALIKIDIVGSYYHDLKIVFNSILYDGETKESVGKILDNLVKNKITSFKEHQLYVMFILIAAIERAALEQEAFVFKPLDDIIEDPQS